MVTGDATGDVPTGSDDDAFTWNPILSVAAPCFRVVLTDLAAAGMNVGEYILQTAPPISRLNSGGEACKPNRLRRRTPAKKLCPLHTVVGDP